MYEQNNMSADEMIRANGAAEAEETERLRALVQEYAGQIEELKTLYQENNLLVGELKKMNIETTRGIQDIMRSVSTRLGESEAGAKSGTDAVDWEVMKDHIAQSAADAASLAAANAVNNSVQSAQGEDSTKLADKIGEDLQALSARTADLIQQSDDFSHKENVRVYRNIQAATDQLLQKQTQEIKDTVSSIGKEKKNRPSVLLILTFLVASLDLAFQICDKLGIVDMALSMIIR